MSTSGSGIIPKCRVRLNGLSAAWCGGLPYYADPQVMYYSVPQLLLLIVNPHLSIFITYVTFGLIGAIGFYGLARHAFGLSPWFALLGAGLFAFNEFYLFRMLIGHLTYHVFPLIPLIAWLVISSANSKSWKRVLLVLSSGILIAYFVHGGAANFLVPGMLAVLGLLSVYLLIHPDRLSAILRGYFTAGLVGFMLSVSKIVAGYAFVRWFPRENLSLGVFDGIEEALFSIFTLLFMNPWISLQ